MAIPAKRPRYARFSLSASEFEAALPFTTQKASMIEAARMVFVQKLSLAAAARMVGTTRQNIDQGLKVFRNAHARSVEFQNRNIYLPSDVQTICQEHEISPLQTDILVLRITKGYAAKGILAALSSKYPEITEDDVYQCVSRHKGKFLQAVQPTTVVAEPMPVDGSAYIELTPGQFRVLVRYTNYTLPQLSFMYHVLVKRTVQGTPLPRMSVKAAHAYVSQKYPSMASHASARLTMGRFLDLCRTGAVLRPALHTLSTDCYDQLFETYRGKEKTMRIARWRLLHGYSISFLKRRLRLKNTEIHGTLGNLREHMRNQLPYLTPECRAEVCSYLENQSAVPPVSGDAHT